MKLTSTLSVLFFILLHQSISAQQNGGFEDWTPSGSPPPFDWSYPTGWTTTNATTEFITAGVNRSEDAHSGEYSAQIKTLNIFGTNTRSQLVLGNAKLDPPMYRVIGYTGGEPLNMIPESVSFFYKLTQQSPFESAVADILIKRREAGDPYPDTVFHHSEYLQGTDAFTEVNIPIPDVEINIETDSIVLVFSSNDTSEFGINFLYVDDVSVDFVSATKPVVRSSSNLVYPNPVHAGHPLTIQKGDVSQVTEIKWIDSFGRTIAEENYPDDDGQFVHLDVCQIPGGIYTLLLNGVYSIRVLVTE